MYSAGPIPSATIFLPTTTTVTATVRESGAQIRIANVVVASGTPSAPVPIRPGPTPIDILATSADQKTEIHYTVVVTGSASQYLKASNTSTGAQFGYSVAISGDTLERAEGHWDIPEHTWPRNVPPGRVDGVGTRAVRRSAL